MLDKINITVIKNPFDIEKGKEKFSLDKESFNELAKDKRWNGKEYIISKNGEVLKCNDYSDFKDGDCVAVMPFVSGNREDRKQVLRVVGVITIAVVATLITGGTILPGLGAIGGKIIGAVVGVGGTFLLNQLLPPPLPDVPELETSLNQSNTYSWQPSRNRINIGDALPVIYGEHFVTPHLLNFFTVSSDTQELRLLFILAEGEITSVTDITINNVPVENYNNYINLTDRTYEEGDVETLAAPVSSLTIVNSSPITVRITINSGEKYSEHSIPVGGSFGFIENLIYSFTCHDRATLQFSGVLDTVSTEVYLGGTTPRTFTGFDETIQQIPANDQMEFGNPSLYQTQGNAVERLRVSMSFPRGVYSINLISGERSRHQVIFQIEYKLIADTTWTAFEDGPFTIAGDSDQPIRSTYEQAVAANRYDIRIRFTVNPSPIREQVSFIALGVVEYIHEIIERPQQFTNVAILAVRAKASPSINGGIPLVRCKLTRSTVNVGTGTKPANNPAWVCHDMIANGLYSAGIDESRMKGFQDWADFCTRKNLTCNIYFDTASSLSQQLSTVSTLGRGFITQRGRDITAFYDDVVVVPSQIFNVSNISNGSFSQGFLENANRYNTIEISYYDRTIENRRRTHVYRQTGFNAATDEEVLISINLIGCDNLTMATQHAEKLLREALFIHESVSISVDIDAITSTINDVVGIQHDVPRWGDGGRIVSGTTTTIVIDKPVHMEPGNTYQVIVRQQSPESSTATQTGEYIETKTIVTPLQEGDFSSLTLSTPLGRAPAAGSLWSFGENEAYHKLFRVTSIARDSEQRARINALEYNANIYLETLPNPTEEPPSRLALVQRLTARLVFESLAGGGLSPVVVAEWQGFALRYFVFVRESLLSTPRRIDDTTGLSLTIPGLIANRTYDIIVSPVDNINGSDAQTTTINIATGRPGRPIGATGQVFGSSVVLSWHEPPSQLDIARYEIFEGDRLVARVAGTIASFVELAPGEHTYTIQAIDTAGERSDGGASVTIDISGDAQRLEIFTSEDLDGGYKVSLLDTTVDDEALLFGPVNISQTWNEWWDYAGFDNAEEFTEAGFDLLLSPDGQESAEYGHRFALPTEIAAGTIQVDFPTFDVIEGNPDSVGVNVEISASDTDIFRYPGEPAGSIIGIDISQRLGSFSFEAMNFRYFIYRVMLSTDGRTVCRFRPRVRVFRGTQRESGIASVTNAATGVTITYSQAFASVQNIILTPIGTTSATPVAEFNAVDVNPTSFVARLFDSSGSLVTGSFSWQVEGFSR